MFFFSPLFVFGQAISQKIGFVDSNLIIEGIPETKEAKEKLKAMVESWRNEIGKKKAELAEKKRDYQMKDVLYTEEIKKDKQAEIQDIERYISDYQKDIFGPGGEYFRQQSELMKPIQRRIFKVMKRVAQEEGYDFIFDRSGDIMIMYANSDYDLTKKVLEGLSTVDK